MKKPTAPPRGGAKGKKQISVYLDYDDAELMRDMAPLADRSLSLAQTFLWYVQWAQKDMQRGQDRAVLALGEPEIVAAVIRALSGILSERETGKSLARNVTDWFRLGDGADLDWPEARIQGLVDVLAEMDDSEATGLLSLARLFANRRAKPGHGQIRVTDFAADAISTALRRQRGA